MEPASERQAAHYYFIQETTIEGWKRRGRAPEYRAALDFGAWLALNVYNVDAAAGLLQVCGLLASEKNGSGFLGFLNCTEFRLRNLRKAVKYPSFKHLPTTYRDRIFPLVQATIEPSKLIKVASSESVAS